MQTLQMDVRRSLADKNVFKKGTKAFYDTFSGLVPCVVVEVLEESYGYMCGPYGSIVFRVTEKVGAYNKGEVLKASASSVPPRKMITRKSYSNRVCTMYKYSKD